MNEIEAMAQVEVRDFQAFWAMFSTGGLTARQSHGCRAARVYQDAADPNRLTILFRWSSEEGLQGFRTDPKVRETMASSGIAAPPVWTLLRAAGELPG